MSQEKVGVYMRFLEQFLVPAVKIFYQSLYNEALQDAQKVHGKTAGNHDLLIFQTRLKTIPKLNPQQLTEAVNKIRQRIEPKAKIDILITAIISEQAKYLIYSLKGIDNVNDLGVLPTPDAFLHRLLVVASAKVFQFPSVMRRFATDSEEKKMEKDRLLTSFVTSALLEIVNETVTIVLEPMLNSSSAHPLEVHGTMVEPKIASAPEDNPEEPKSVAIAVAAPSRGRTPGPTPLTSPRSLAIKQLHTQMTQIADGPQDPRIGDLQQHFFEDS